MPHAMPRVEALARVEGEARGEGSLVDVRPLSVRVAEAEGVAHLVHRHSFEVETLAARRNHAAHQRHLVNS